MPTARRIVPAAGSAAGRASTDTVRGAGFLTVTPLPVPAGEPATACFRFPHSVKDAAMTATLTEPMRRTRRRDTTETHSPADRLRTETAAVRVSFTWFGTRKALTPGQKAEAAEAFGAEGTFLSAGKKLLDTRHPSFKAVTAIKGQATAYWRSNALSRRATQRWPASFRWSVKPNRVELHRKSGWRSSHVSTRLS